MKSPETYRHIIAKTRFGPAAIVWEHRTGKPAVRQILLSKPGLRSEAARKDLYPDSAEASCRLIDDLAARIAAFLEGADVSFSLEAMRLDLCPPFQRRVLLARRQERHLRKLCRFLFQGRLPGEHARHVQQGRCQDDAPE